MAKNFEIEAKFLLSEDDFNKICCYFNINSFFKQTNYYFDSNDYSLLNNKCAFRVRLTKNNEYEACLKIPYKDGLMETNVIISEDDFNKLINHQEIEIVEIENNLNKINLSLNDLYFIAKLETNRQSILYKEGELFFDKSNYFNNFDYEIEYEVNSSLEKANNILLELFKELKINSYHKGYSKIKRCIEYKRGC